MPAYKTYSDAIASAANLIEDSASDNPEYARGICELIADLFPTAETPYIADRKMEVAADLGIKLNGKPSAAMIYVVRPIDEERDVMAFSDLGIAETMHNTMVIHYDIDVADVETVKIMDMAKLRDNLRIAEGEGQFRDIPVGHVDNLSDEQVIERLIELQEEH